MYKLLVSQEVGATWFVGFVYASLSGPPSGFLVLFGLVFYGSMIVMFSSFRLLVSFIVQLLL